MIYKDSVHVMQQKQCIWVVNQSVNAA